MGKFHIRLIAFCLLAASAGTQTPPGGVPLEVLLKHPAFTVGKEDPSLPRVLLVGDSISIGYTVATRKLLQGRANMLHIRDNCRSTAYSLDHIDEWLGEDHWDVIHFNWGLHDLMLKSGRAQVPLDEYAVNLRRLVARLKKTGARLVFATTTPVPAGVRFRPEGSELAYNLVACRIMREQGNPVNDLHALAAWHLAEIQPAGDVHFFDWGYEVLARQVAADVEHALKSR